MVSSRCIAITLGLSVFLFPGAPAEAPHYRAVPVPAGTVQVKGEYLKAFLAGWKDWGGSPRDRRLENYDVDFTLDGKYIDVDLVPRTLTERGIERRLAQGARIRVRRSDYKVTETLIPM